MSTYEWPWLKDSWPTIEQLWKGLNEAPPEDRENLLRRMLVNAQEGQACALKNHYIELRVLTKERDEARKVLSALAALIRAEHTPEEGMISDHGGQDTVTYCAGCAVDLDEEECKYLAILDGKPQLHAYLAPPEPKAGDTVHYLGTLDIRSLGISPGPNAFGYSIEMVDKEEQP